MNEPTIGFLDSEVSTLEDFKQCIDAYPEHAYVAYIDTLQTPYANLSNEELSLALKIGCVWLAEKKATTIAVKRSYLQTAAQMLALLHLPMIDLIDIETANEYLEALIDAPAVSTPGRIIHLTKHSKESDTMIALILGGYFITQK